MQDSILFVAYATPLVLVWAAFALFRRHRDKAVIAVRSAALETGMTEPPSLHPLIDDQKCIGCAACVTACPEGQILGLINGKAQLVEPSSCIGHGACAAACPLDAISLVFGTEKRGVDIPHVGADFQTNVPGIYIAGELGGMGLIKNAIEQGRQAMDEIRRTIKSATDDTGDMLDTVIIGAGPAGYSASLGAMEHGLRAVTLEQDSLGGTVSHFPRGKLVMTAPANLPVYGKVRFREVLKEELLEFWEKVAADTGLKINFEEGVETIDPIPGGFCVKTTKGSYLTRTVLLAIGRRGTPRKLNVPGEELSKVVYRLIDPEQYRGQNVLVVGGGDSALEAAVSIAEEPGTQVTLSYRSDGFSRAKHKNRLRVEQACSDGNLQLALSSQVLSIQPEFVELSSQNEVNRIKNDVVIVCAGGILPTGFLKSIGISIETKHGTA